MGDYCYYDEYGRLRSTRGASLGWKPWSSPDPYKEIGKNENYSKKSTIKNKSEYREAFSTKKYRTGSKIFSTKCSCPACKGVEIFFCDCKNGGKVFFETLYPEWKKHNCPCFQKEKQSLNPKEIDYYSLVFPSSFKENKLFYKKINGLDNFTIEIKNKYIYNNATRNINLLVKYEKSKIILKVILSSKKFLNYILVNNAIFDSFQEFKQFLIYILTQTDLSEDKDFRIIYNSKNTIIDKKSNDTSLNTKNDDSISLEGLETTKWKGIYRSKGK